MLEATMRGTTVCPAVKLINGLSVPLIKTTLIAPVHHHHNPFSLRGVGRRPMTTHNLSHSSDIGHWDVPDITEVLEEAYEMVEDKVITEDDFKDFTFTNPVKLLLKIMVSGDIGRKGDSICISGINPTTLIFWPPHFNASPTGFLSPMRFAAAWFRITELVSA